MDKKFNYIKFRRNDVLSALELLDDEKKAIPILVDKILEQQDYICELKRIISKLDNVIASTCVQVPF